MHVPMASCVNSADAPMGIDKAAPVKMNAMPEVRPPSLSGIRNPSSWAISRRSCAAAGAEHHSVITQRPAMLVQADILIAIKLPTSQDRDAVAALIEGQTDRAGEARASS